MTKRKKHRGVVSHRALEVQTHRADQLAMDNAALQMKCDKLTERLGDLQELVAHKKEYERLVERLTYGLTLDEREAARISNISEAEYAINLVRLCRQKLDDIKSWQWRPGRYEQP